MPEITTPTDRPCPVCDTVVRRHGAGPSGGSIDAEATLGVILGRVAADELHVLRADVALEDMLALAASDLKYTIVSFLRCERCHGTRFWGLCIRGEPSYTSVEPGAEDRWRWQEVPPRARWSGSAG